MANKLSTWLANEIQTRGWSIRELSRRAGISHTTVADVISQQRIPTWDFCAAIASALGESPEKIFRMADLLPPIPPPVEEEREAIGLLRNLPPDLRAVAIRILHVLQPDSAPPPSAPAIAESQEPYPEGDLNLAPDPSIELLGELWEQVPDWKKRDIVDQINRAVEEHEQEIEKKKSEKKVGN